MPECIDILLATCNGARYLAEQLDSLFAQSYQDWRLLVRDDVSDDATPAILDDYLNRYPDRISMVPHGGQRLGPAGNFAVLLGESSASRVMFCDQDDVWLPDKIETTLAAMTELERRHGADLPLLVHTDLRVVAEDLTPLGESFWCFQGSDPTRLTTLNRVLLQNYATGCTVMINRPLVDLALPVPAEARMHDWWLALVALVFGRVAAVSRPTVLYRQHGSNDTGAARWSFCAEVLGFFNRERRRRAVERRNLIFASLETQAAAFLTRYQELLGPESREILRLFATLRSRNFFMRRYLSLRHGFIYSNRLMTLGMILFR
jgi:glycosyltransferase involved in cell wall biosynthesis